MPLAVGIFMINQLKRQLFKQVRSPDTCSTKSSAFSSDAFSLGIDLMEEDLEDDDMPLYTGVDQNTQNLLMRIRLALQSSLINQQALSTMTHLDGYLETKINRMREIQEEKMRILSYLQDAETQEEINSAIAMKKEFDKKYGRIQE